MIFKGFRLGLATGAFVTGFAVFYGTAKALTKYINMKLEQRVKENFDEEDSNSSDDDPGADDAIKSKG